VYFVVLEDVKNPEGMAGYGPKARDAPNAGRVLAGGEPTVIEGEWHGDRAVVIEFEDQAHFRAWYDSPEYQEALKIRLAATDSRAALVPGFVPRA
jgi:uncharacterized protein (DUF1330 family)